MDYKNLYLRIVSSFFLILLLISAAALKTSSGSTLAYRSSDTQGTFISWIKTYAVSGNDRIFTVSDVE